LPGRRHALGRKPELAGGIGRVKRHVGLPGVLALRVPGYACSREFYAPRYDVASARPNLPDPRRSTLYWNPQVRTNAAGQADVTFYTADAAGQFRLSAEGVSAAGQPAVGAGSLLVRLRLCFPVALPEPCERRFGYLLLVPFLWLPLPLLSP
jgi:hypothetical protein